jgi:hypothetical protein
MSLSQLSFADFPKNAEYNDPVIMDEFHFTALLGSGSVSMRWDPYVPNDFQYYKLIRSTTNIDPIFPEDGYLIDSQDHSFASYVDNNPPKGTVTYRICSIAHRNRYCSRPSVIFNPGGGVVKTTATVKAPEINLKGSIKENYVDLEWTVTDGTAPNGFKIAKSEVNQNPVYPPLSGDTYGFLPSPDGRSRKDYDVKPGATYYYRICLYDGSVGCDVYSNAVKVEVPSDFVPVKKDIKVLNISKSESVSGLQIFSKNGYSFSYPQGWFTGAKYSRDYFSEQKDYIDNLGNADYINTGTYVATYIADRHAKNDSALYTKAPSDYKLVSSSEKTVNGYKTLIRKYMVKSANQIIILYTYRNGSYVYSIQYFNASGNESYGVDQFNKIANSFVVK